MFRTHASGKDAETSRLKFVLKTIINKTLQLFPRFFAASIFIGSNQPLPLFDHQGALRLSFAAVGYEPSVGGQLFRILPHDLVQRAFHLQHLIQYRCSRLYLLSSRRSASTKGYPGSIGRL
ncbi:uncharacterized protein UDID_17181 [Ustilago sp. UG-2017a]|nr:uncharacterized protein UDID_17181 [Ustilago sp. UG-2017a]